MATTEQTPLANLPSEEVEAVNAFLNEKSNTNEPSAHDTEDGATKPEIQQEQSQQQNSLSEKQTSQEQPQQQESSPKEEPESQKQTNGSGSSDSKPSGPEGGFDSTPIPKPPNGAIGYTLKITMHRASNLVMGDMQTLSSDPYVLAQMNTDVPKRHKEDPYLRFRTFTKRRTTEPEWNENWVVANVPSSGFKLKLRLYDEDPADHDDLLGKASITVDSIDDNWNGIKEESYKLSVKQSSKRAVLVRSVAACFRMVPRHIQGDVVVSIENLGRTENDGQNGRLYTVGECRWFRHHSPILGRLTHTKDPSKSDAHKKNIDHYNFQANQMQLAGPVPSELYHRFVEFKPWVKRMFTTTGWQGAILGKALHHQHARVYNFGRSTVWGHFPQGPCEEMTKKFLDLVHYDEGGRIYTYVLTLDSLWRFTETGKEFGIDMLSKHTMHSDVSIYIAFSGEFFVRRLKHKHRPPPPDPAEGSSAPESPDSPDNDTHPPHDIEGGPPNDDPPTDPSYYELIIDNDSGTYRPNAKMLPLLAKFLSHSLPGLHIRTLDSQADADKMARMKSEQRERKKREGDQIVYTQDRASSISSSDEEDLDRAENDVASQQRPDDFLTGDGGNHERGTAKAFARDVKQHHAARLNKMKNEYRRSRDGNDENEDEDGDQDARAKTSDAQGAAS